jgi:RNA recognition motif-containing protein
LDASGGVWNEGTLIVFNITPTTSLDDVRVMFMRCGEVMEVRNPPERSKQCKFVEFFDIRHANAAVATLHRVELHGAQVSPCEES